MRYKLLSIALLSAIAIPSAVIGQDKPEQPEGGARPPRERAERQRPDRQRPENPGGPPVAPLDRVIEQSASRLELTDEQKQKVQALASDLATRTKALHEEALKQLKAILTEEQFKQFEQLQARARAGGPGGGPGAGAGGPLGIADRIRQALDRAGLSEDQKTQLKPAWDEFKKKIEEIRATFQPRGGAGPEAREKLRAAIREFHTSLQGVLTREQLEKVRELLPEPGGRPNRRPDQQ